MICCRDCLKYLHSLLTPVKELLVFVCLDVHNATCTLHMGKCILSKMNHPNWIIACLILETVRVEGAFKKHMQELVYRWENRVGYNNPLTSLRHEFPHQKALHDFVS